MKVIIAGSRKITSLDLVSRTVDAAHMDITEVVSGCAQGVDKLGELWAAANGIPVARFPAEWDRLGRSAGYRRNEQMANYADGLIAIWDGQSKGTQHMVNIARSQQLHVYLRTLLLNGHGTYEDQEWNSGHPKMLV